MRKVKEINNLKDLKQKTANYIKEGIAQAEIDNFINLGIQDLILNKKANKDEMIVWISSECKNIVLQPKTLGVIFELYAEIEPIDTDYVTWFSREITINELRKIHKDFATTNGCQWARTDQSYLGKKYVVKRNHKGGKIWSVKLEGKNKTAEVRKRAIRKDIYNNISKKKCAILDISSEVQVDHKDGHYDVPTNQDLQNQQEHDFQPLCRTANDAKRTHCNRCKETGKRYAAKRLGYSVSFLFGGENTQSCQGCYWYDPQYFNRKISENYNKDK